METFSVWMQSFLGQMQKALKWQMTIFFLPSPCPFRHPIRFGHVFFFNHSSKWFTLTIHREFYSIIIRWFLFSWSLLKYCAMESFRAHSLPANTYILFAAAQLTQLIFSQAQLTLQIQHFRLSWAFFGQHALQALLHLWTETHVYTNLTQVQHL